MLSDGISGEWNFGPSLDEKHSVRELVETFAKSWGIDDKKQVWRHEHSEQPHEAGYLLLDSNKAKVELGWNEKLNFSTSINLTTSWFKQSETQNPLELTVNQIQDFLSIN